MPVGTDVIRGPARTDQLPSLGQTAPLPLMGRTDPLPSLTPQQATDVIQRPPTEKRTDPERKPLGAVEPLELDNSTIPIRDSVKPDVQKRVAESRAKEPTVLKPRTLSLDLPIENSAPTLAAEPQRPPRSPLVLAASVVAAVVVLGGAGWALTRSPTVEPTPSEPVKAPVAELKPVAVVEPPQPQPVAEEAVDAGVVVAAIETRPPLEPVVVPTKTPEAKPEVKVEPKPVAVALRMGVLNVKAIPFAEILIDGKKSGEVQGTRQLKVAVGKHRVTLVHPKRSESFEVVVDGKAAADISFNLNR